MAKITLSIQLMKLWNQTFCDFQHTIAGMPNWQYNPIELAWADCKKYYNTHISSQLDSSDKSYRSLAESTSTVYKRKVARFHQTFRTGSEKWLAEIYGWCWQCSTIYNKHTFRFIRFWTWPNPPILTNHSNCSLQSQSIRM